MNGRWDVVLPEVPRVVLVGDNNDHHLCVIDSWENRHRVGRVVVVCQGLERLIERSAGAVTGTLLDNESHMFK